MGRITEKEKDTPMSLEKLLAKEGFKEKKLNMFTRAFSQSQPVSLQLYPYRAPRKSKKTDRVKSDIPKPGWSAKLPPTNITKGKFPKGIHFRNETIDEKLSVESREKSERIEKYLRDAQCSSVDPLEDFADDDKAESDDLFDSNKTYKDIYSNETYSHQTSEITEFNKEKKMKQVEKSYYRSRTLADMQNIGDDKNHRYYEVEQNSPEPSIDEAATRAVISIFNGYIKRFLRDGDFRTSFRHNCFASLNFAELEEDLITQSKVLANLEQAIEVVERAAEKSASERELKKASLQLSVITGLNSNELKDEFTSGIPNSKLSACAHLYLSVVYKLQKKDRIAARQILQVFTNSPFQARTILLPELWEHMFLPHLVHLKEWYDQEVESLGDDNTPSKGRKLKLLEKVYNEIIDSGTYQFAVYYKNWLSDGIEAPIIPSINAPISPFEGLKQGSSRYEKGSTSDHLDMSNNPVGSLSPYPVVSRKLYDTMFGRSRKPEIDDAEDSKRSGILSNIVTKSGNSLSEEKQALPSSSIVASHTEQIDARDEESHPEEELEAKDVKTVHQASVPVQVRVSDKLGKSPPSMVNTEVIDLMLKELARSVLDEPKTDAFLNLVATEDKEAYPKSNPVRMNFITKEHNAIKNIPEDFICPLTGLVFEEPVTLQTGHTYEKEAIKEWLNEGNRTCPISGKTLECRSIPATNFILKRFIDGWKSENHSKIQKEETILFIHNLLSAFSQGRLKVSGE